MKTTMKVKVLNGRIISVKTLESNIYELEVELEETKVDEHFDNVIVRIEASQLSLKDKFMSHKPQNDREKKLKDQIIQVINSGIKDFFRPRIDPSFDDKKEGICYKSGNNPVVGKSYLWWNKIAKDYDSKRRSRLGTKSEYVAFLGVLIKSLVNEGWSVEDAWHAVCQDSKKLGHYLNSEDAKNKLEPTGSRKICGFFDLANTFKILAEDVNEKSGGFWLAGGSCNYDSSFNPLSDLYHYYYCDSFYDFSVGWLVLEEGSTDH